MTALVLEGNGLLGRRQGSVPAGGPALGDIAMGSSLGASSTYVVIPRLPRVHDAQVAWAPPAPAVDPAGSFLFFWGMDMIKASKTRGA